MIENENTAKFKSEKFAIQIVNLYKYLCSKEKFYISLKEILEIIYWLALLYETKYIDEKQFISIKNDCKESRKMLSFTTKIMRSTLNFPNSKLNETE